MNSENNRGFWKTKAKLLILFLTVTALLAGGVSVMAQASSSPKAWVSSYADGRTSGLRVSEMLEIKTSGFSPEAELEYEYEWSGMFPLFPYQSMTSPDTAYYRYTYGDRRYVAIVGADAKKDKLKVKVTDVNPSSSTYNKSATTSYSKFKAASLSKDLSNGAYGMFLGEEEEILKLLGRGGVLHITCSNSNTQSCVLTKGSSVSLSGSGNDTTITAVAYGESRCKVSVKKNDDCSFHSGQTGSGEIIIYVFDKPTAKAKYSDSIVLTNTEPGVTYSVNGVSKTCTTAGQELVFSGLQPETKYGVVCSKVIDGKTVSTSFNKTTNGKVWIHYDNNNMGDTAPDSLEMYAGYTLARPTSKIPVVESYYLEGWHKNMYADDAAWNFDVDLVETTMTLYANWEPVPNTLNITLKKDDAAWTGQKIELYNGLEKAYELTETGGVYTSNEVINGTYDIYVNGENVYRPVTFYTRATTKDGGDVENRTLEYYSVEISTTLNDGQSAEPGEAHLRQGHRTWNTFTNENGIITGYALKDGDGTSGSEYDLYIGDAKVREKINAEGSNRFELHFYEVELALTHDAVWTTAHVTLRNDMGITQHTLYYEETNGTTAYYRDIVQADEEGAIDTYRVFVKNQDTHEVVRIAKGGVTPEDYEKACTFYKASATVRTDNMPDTLTRVTLNNGVDTTKLLDTDGDGIYEENVLYNTADGAELVYEVIVKDVTDNAPAYITRNAGSVELDYYNLICHITVGGTEIVNTLKVRKNMCLSTPASPVNNGRAMEGWYYEREFVTMYDFSAPVTQRAELYGKLEGQKVVMNGYIKTEADGTLSGTGLYYRMPNLAISGFPNGDVMTGFLLETTGCISITILPDNAPESMTILPDNELSGNVLTISEGTVIVQFMGNVTAKELQSFLRNNIIVQPDPNAEHHMRVTVYGLTD